MEMNILQKRIEEKAQRRINKEHSNALALLRSNPILVRLLITISEDTKLSMCSSNGYCPARDLFHNGLSIELLEKHTNYGKVCEELKTKYIEEETDNILNQLILLQKYINAE